MRPRGRKKTPAISRIPPRGSSNRSGNRSASAAIPTAAIDLGLRFDQAAGRVRVGIAIQSAATTMPIRPHAPRHITVDWLVEAPGKTQSRTAVVIRITAKTPTSKRRAPAFGSSITLIMTPWLINGPIDGDCRA
jgi:hypothetical protein